MIYFVQRESDKLIKIGMTASPQARIQTIQTQHGRVTLLGWLSGDYLTENQLHKQFRDIRVAGEWFRPSPELLTFIEKKTCNITLEDIPSAVFSLWKNNRKLEKELEHLRQMNKRLLASYNRLFYEEEPTLVERQVK